MVETVSPYRPDSITVESLPVNLSTRAKNCIFLAHRDGRLESIDDLRSMSDREIMWGVMGRGQVHGIGKKTLMEIRSFFPRSQQ